MPVITLTVDERLITASEGETILQAASAAGIVIPTLCNMEGLSAHGGCRLCLIEIEGSSRLQPACWMKAAEGQVVHTQTSRLQDYRRMILELLFAEGNHVCSVCVANGHCELQTLAAEHGVDHIRWEYQHPVRKLDISHQRFGFDPNRCVLCTRCVRTCDELEGAHTWDLAGRGAETRLVADMDQPWGDAATCTSCGKCFMACPTGAIFAKGSSASAMEHDRGRLEFLIRAREQCQWDV